GSIVEFVRDLLIGRGSGPVRGEDVIGLATQEQGVHPPNVPGDEAQRLLVEQRRLPAAVLEAPLGVFFRSAGRLHDAVQGYHFTDDELAHDVTARLTGKPRKRVRRPRQSDVVARLQPRPWGSEEKQAPSAAMVAFDSAFDAAD